MSRLDPATASGLTPAEAGRALAAQAPPLSDAQVDEAARILAAVAVERMQQAS